MKKKLHMILFIADPFVSAMKVSAWMLVPLPKLNKTSSIPILKIESILLNLRQKEKP
jgi:hypothetical protein